MDISIEIFKRLPMKSSLKACPHCRRKVRRFVAENSDCRRKVRVLQKSATVAEFRRCLAVFCDSRTFLRQCGQGFRLSPSTSQPIADHILVTRERHGTGASDIFRSPSFYGRSEGQPAVVVLLGSVVAQLDVDKAGVAGRSLPEATGRRR